MILAFLLAVRAFFAMLGLAPENRFLLDDLWTWFDVGGLKLDIAFWLDPLSMVMTLIVTGVGGLIHIYSTGYMHDDEAYWRFFAWLNLFTFAMLMLVLGDNLLLMFVGWEGVGLCSYALIGFWYKELANASAGNKAFIVNRVGDFGFVLGAVQAVLGARARSGIRRWSRARSRSMRRCLQAHHLPAYFGLSVVGLRHAAALRRRDRQVGADSALRLAARRDGGSDAGQRADPRRDDGHRRRLHDRRG